MSLSLFTVIPMKKNVWDERAGNLLIPFFPAVGAVLGIVWYLTAVLLRRYAMPVMISSLVITMLPFVFSGFFHLDGFMDTADAVGSRRSMERKREILKDSHVGAFAVIAMAFLLLTVFSMVVTLTSEQQPLASLLWIPVLSRSVAGAAILWVRPFSGNGYASLYRTNMKLWHKCIPILTGILCICISWYLGSQRTAVAALFAAAAGIAAGGWVCRQLGGISGDLAGFILTVTEAAALTALVW